MLGLIRVVLQYHELLDRVGLYFVRSPMDCGVLRLVVSRDHVLEVVGVLRSVFGALGEFGFNCLDRLVDDRK